MVASFQKLGWSLGTRLGYVITGLGKSGTCIMGELSQVVSVWTLHCVWATGVPGGQNSLIPRPSPAQFSLPLKLSKEKLFFGWLTGQVCG